MRRNLYGILLFLVLVAPIAATYTFLRYQKKLVRKEIKRKIIAGIDKNELVFLKFSQKEKETLLKWEHSKEFEYKGEMYDVVESKTMGDTTYFWCWWDHEETKLNKLLSELVKNAWNEKPVNQQSQKRLLAFYNLLFFTESEHTNTIARLASDKAFAYIQMHYLSRPLSPPVPPPKVL
ncbi:MAG: hypothetical protein BWY70_00826 [Bacteroidetes bacterium ADurb.Bin408]|nr:MAG: hypothetical protein BWY70_00826 [Bacteroidetes bacterium ADurb.Bin408]